MPRLVNSFIHKRMQHVVNQQFTDSCLVEVRTVGTGVYGEPKTGFTTVYLSMPCRIIRVGARMKSSAVTVGEGVSIRDSYRIVYPTTYSLSVAMRVTTRDGLRYDIDAIQENDTDSVQNESFMTRQIGDQP